MTNLKAMMDEWDKFPYPDEYSPIIQALREAVDVISFYKDQWRYTGNCATPPDAHTDILGKWDKGYKAQDFLKKWGLGG